MRRRLGVAEEVVMGGSSAEAHSKAHVATPGSDSAPPKWHQASGTVGVTSFHREGGSTVQLSKGPCKVLGTQVKNRGLYVTVAPGGTRALLREQRSGAGRRAQGYRCVQVQGLVPSPWLWC